MRSWVTGEQRKLNGVARRLRNHVQDVAGSTLMETVVCSNCGQRFAIRHDSASEDAGLAGRQATWLADQLVWDHIQERKHHGSIDLPSLA